MTALPPLTKPPITREQLKLYAEASTDPNPIHLDDQAAKKAGLPGVIAHGMITMAFMGEFLHAIRPGQVRILEISCRFRAMTFPGDVITVSGSLNGQNVTMETRNQKGELTATGSAVIDS
jgi:acyl dehydratase